ncbi:sulfotransferase family protein [Streptomyces sp. NPDC002088]|uniref:sulfotransferase-like domain-containing protein n=1 Tax=Streptomyces sp. NPDC002088 TaxID=3154665 RepID=UPI00332DBEEF
MTVSEQQSPGLLGLWSAPRSRSTAFLRMMAERGDFTVVHEPFSHVADFQEKEIDGRVVRTEAELIEALTAMARGCAVFFKDTTDFAYPGLLADRRFLAEATHTFIVRDPAEVIASHFALNPDLRCEEVGIERLHEIHQAVTVATGRRPVVVDAQDLVRRPEQTVRAYCAAVGIPFLTQALAWRPGMREDWTSTRRWHENTSRTGGFVSTRSEYAATVHNHPVLAGYLRHHLPFYEELHAARLAVPDEDPAPAHG